MPSSGGESSTPPDGVGSPSNNGSGHQEIDSVRELNRLLESALRMGGDGKVDGSLSTAGAAGASADTDDRGNNMSSADTASLRLDTARRLSSVSILFCVQ